MIAEPNRPEDVAQHGAKYDGGKPRMDLIPAATLLELGKLYAAGAVKYADRNWERGIRYGRCYAAAQRHLLAFWSGEDIDPETGISHLVAAAWNCFALDHFQRSGEYGEFDDRPRGRST